MESTLTPLFYCASSLTKASAFRLVTISAISNKVIPIMAPARGLRSNVIRKLIKRVMEIIIKLVNSINPTFLRVNTFLISTFPCP